MASLQDDDVDAAATAFVQAPQCRAGPHHLSSSHTTTVRRSRRFAGSTPFHMPPMPLALAPLPSTMGQ
jgi:hypothetical protein